MGGIDPERTKVGDREDAPLHVGRDQLRGASLLDEPDRKSTRLNSSHQ